MTTSIEKEEKPAPIIFGDESLSDVTLIVGNQEFKANKMFLAYRSDVFKAMFYGNFKEGKDDRVEIKDVSAKNFRRFLEIIFTGKTSDSDKFLEFKFHDKKHYGVIIDPKVSVDYISSLHCYRTPSYQKHFYNFWNDTTEILNIADRFNIVSLVKDYFGYIIAIATLHCTENYCCHCFNATIFALLNRIDLSKCEKTYPKYLYDSWIDYAGEKPFPEAIPIKMMKMINAKLTE